MCFNDLPLICRSLIYSYLDCDIIYNKLSKLKLYNNQEYKLSLSYKYNHIFDISNKCLVCEMLLSDILD